MRTIIHDLEKNLKLQDAFFIDNTDIKSCVGCFSCWIKTPMVCACQDKLKQISDILLKSDELIIISKCKYGCYSYKVKQILERCISFVEPYFVIRNKEIHHKPRTNKIKNLSVYFYGQITDEDKLIAKNLVKANSKNFNMELKNIYFFEKLEDLEENLYDLYYKC